MSENSITVAELIEVLQKECDPEMKVACLLRDSTYMFDIDIYETYDTLTKQSLLVFDSNDPDRPIEENV